MRRRFALGLSVLALTACGGQVPPAQNYAVVTGRAFDSATNQPVSGVTVTVDAIDTAVTGNDGVYRIPNVPLGACTFNGAAPPSGYRVADPSALQCGSVVAGQVVTIDIPLVKQP